MCFIVGHWTTLWVINTENIMKPSIKATKNGVHEHREQNGDDEEENVEINNPVSQDYGVLEI